MQLNEKLINREVWINKKSIVAHCAWTLPALIDGFGRAYPVRVAALGKNCAIVHLMLDTGAVVVLRLEAQEIYNTREDALQEPEVSAVKKIDKFGLFKWLNLAVNLRRPCANHSLPSRHENKRAGTLYPAPTEFL